MNISKYRNEAAMSQRELARQLGVSNVAVHYWETKKTIPHLLNLQKMAKIFGCSVDDLIGEDAK